MIVDDFFAACDYLGMADDVHQAQKGAGKQDANLRKHNRNATDGLKQPDRAKEDTDEARVKAELQAKRGIRPGPKYTNYESILDRVVNCRRKGLSLRQILSVKGMPSDRTIERMFNEHPEYRDSYNEAYDDYIRAEVEEIVSRIDQVDDAPGFTNLPVELSVKTIKRGLPYSDQPQTVHDHAMLLLRHARGQGQIRIAKVRAALEIAERRLPAEWGKDRDQEQQVIVFEVPGGWMLSAATARPEDPDGQGPEAAKARERWHKMRDVTP